MSKKPNCQRLDGITLFSDKRAFMAIKGKYTK